MMESQHVRTLRVWRRSGTCVKGVLYLVDLWLVETGLEHDEPGVPKDIR